MTLTTEQLQQAARKLCQLRGHDPDRMIGHGAPPDANGIVPAVMLHSPAWRFAMKEIEDLMQVAEAIDSVIGAE